MNKDKYINMERETDRERVEREGDGYLEETKQYTKR